MAPPLTRLRQLVDLPAALRELASIGPLLSFWQDGGIRLAHSLPEARGAPCEIALLLQPDGDALLILPRSFGERPGDAEAARELLSAGVARLEAIVGGVSVALPALVRRAIDGCLLAIWIIATMAAAPLTVLAEEFWQVASPLALPLALTGARVLFAKRLMPVLTKMVLKRLCERLTARSTT